MVKRGVTNKLIDADTLIEEGKEGIDQIEKLVQQEVRKSFVVSPPFSPLYHSLPPLIRPLHLPLSLLVLDIAWRKEEQTIRKVPGNYDGA